MPKIITLSPQSRQKIVSDYLNGSSSTKIAQKYGISYQYILSFLRKMGITIRKATQTSKKYEINEKFFDDINTPDKAYFLGMLYADGCNSRKTNTVRLHLTGEDKDILEKLTALIYPQGRPLEFIKSGTSMFWGKELPRKESYVLIIGNKHISETLDRHGLVNAKSLILTFPKWMSKDLVSHFTRGYFDGDGSLSLSNGQIQISMLGTENFCSNLQKITNKLHIKSSICHAKKGSSIKQYVIHGNQTGRTFLEWLYKDANIYMNRKHNKYLEVLNVIPKARPIKCSNCNEKYYALGYCKKHYYEFIGRKIRHDRYMATKNSVALGPCD